MRTHRAFRPVVESMSSRLLLTGFVLTNPVAPILVPKTPPLPSPLPTDPIKITETSSIDALYVGPDCPTSVEFPAAGIA